MVPPPPPPQHRFFVNNADEDYFSDDEGDDAFSRLLLGDPKSKPTKTATSTLPKWTAHISGLDPSLSITEIKQTLFLQNLIPESSMSVARLESDPSIVALSVFSEDRNLLNTVIEFWDGRYIGGGTRVTIKKSNTPSVSAIPDTILAESASYFRIKEHRFVTALAEQVFQQGPQFEQDVKEVHYYDPEYSFLFNDQEPLAQYYRFLLLNPSADLDLSRVTCLGREEISKLLVLLQNAESNRRGDIARVLDFVMKHFNRDEYLIDEMVGMILSSVTRLGLSGLYCLNDVEFNIHLNVRTQGLIKSQLNKENYETLSKWKRDWESPPSISSVPSLFMGDSSEDGTEISENDALFYNSFL